MRMPRLSGARSCPVTVLLSFNSNLLALIQRFNDSTIQRFNDLTILPCIVQALRLSKVADVAPGFQQPGAVLVAEYIPTAVETFETVARLREDAQNVPEYRTE